MAKHSALGTRKNPTRARLTLILVMGVVLSLLSFAFIGDANARPPGDRIGPSQSTSSSDFAGKRATTTVDKLPGYCHSRWSTFDPRAGWNCTPIGRSPDFRQAAGNTASACAVGFAFGGKAGCVAGAVGAAVGSIPWDGTWD